MAISLHYNSVASMLTMKLTGHYTDFFKTVERLASGNRINHAADDPAGLSVSSFLRTNISALGQGARNVNDAISLMQTADGAMQLINDTLVRMKEIAMQASTGTYNTGQRAAMNEEFQALANEITRIATMTDFNSKKLLDGSLASPYDGNTLTSTGAVRVHVGNDSTDFYDLMIESVTAVALGLGYDVGDATLPGYAISTQEQAQTAIVAVAAAIKRATDVHESIGTSQNRLAATVKHLAVHIENLTAAESRVSNADIAQEMIRYVRDKIVTQTATALFSQANSMPSMALTLLKNGIATSDNTRKESTPQSSPESAAPSKAAHLSNQTDMGAEQKTTVQRASTNTPIKALKTAPLKTPVYVETVNTMPTQERAQQNKIETKLNVERVDAYTQNTERYSSFLDKA